LPLLVSSLPVGKFGSGSIVPAEQLRHQDWQNNPLFGIADPPALSYAGGATSDKSANSRLPGSADSPAISASVGGAASPAFAACSCWIYERGHDSFFATISLRAA